MEKLVNQAKCPTRVELSVATENQGLREGFKWLVKTVIASLPELGPRVAADVERERLAEETRRAELRKRLEQKRKEENSGEFLDWHHQAFFGATFAWFFRPVFPFGYLLFIHASTNATGDHKYSPLPFEDFDIAKVLVSFSAFIFS